MMSNYEAPIFGRVDLLGYDIKGYDYSYVLPAKNRPNAQVKDEWGRVTDADLFFVESSHATSAYSTDALQKAHSLTVHARANSALAVLAIPRRYGSYANTAVGANYHYWDEIMISRMASLSLNENLCFDYYLVQDNDSYPTLTIPNTLQNGKFVWRVDPDYYRYSISRTTLQITEKSKAEGTTAYNNNPTIGFSTVFERGIWGKFTALEENMDYLVHVILYSNDKKVAPNAPYYLPETFDIINSAIDLAKEGEFAAIVEKLYTKPFPTQAMKIGSQIQTGLPVFTIEHIDEMIKYFAKQPFQADNDIFPPPSDWSTNWDVYVKGAQKPDIFITMKSDKVDEWLANIEDNTSGASKKDIKVEYRYKIAGSIGDNDIDSGKIVDWLKDQYNETRATSYIENIQLNYQRNMQIAGEFSDFTILNLMNIYATLEFRLSYMKYKSSWCGYKVGVIGSPSVPDFSKMMNEGGQKDSWTDESTVTLHYDEFPPDYNPYPDPPDPEMPEPAPTDPHPSQTGLGLLTTTYKVTEENLRALGRFFWGGDLFQKIKALNLSPIENVVGVHIMPINISGSTDIIFVGDVKTNINGDRIDTVPLYNLGSVEIKGRYSYYDMNYLDFEPYTTAHIFLPYVGFIRIDPQYFTNKTLKVIYSYDIICGLCNAMLFADDIYIESHQGNCGIDIPLVSSNRAELAVGLATSLINTAADAATTKAATFSTLGTSVSVLDSLSDFVSGFHSSRQGGYSPTCAWTETRECFVVLETPNASVGTSFAHDFGRPCMSTYSIASLSGFTICDSSVDLSGIAGATEEEKDMIRELLTTGFYA